MRKALIIVQALALSSLAVYGAFADGEGKQSCPLPQAHSHHCAHSR